jgi:GAF domain-containing protein
VFAAVTARRAPADARASLAALDLIKAADQELLFEALKDRDAMFDRVRDAVRGLGQFDSTEALLDPAVAAVCALGFDRAILSRVEDAEWVPERVHVARDTGWAKEILAVGGANPQILEPGLVDTEMVRRRVGILVRDVQQRPGVNRPIARVSRSRSYAAAPLVVGGRVVGFLHADCYYQDRDPSEFDRRVLTGFAEGLSQAIGRTATMDRVGALSARLGRLAQPPGVDADRRPGAAEARGARLARTGEANERRLVLGGPDDRRRARGDADPPGGRGAGAAGRRGDQRPDRPPPRRLRGHRQDPREEHPAQARGGQPGGRRRALARPALGPARSSPNPRLKRDPGVSRDVAAGHPSRIRERADGWLPRVTSQAHSAHRCARAGDAGGFGNVASPLPGDRAVVWPSSLALAWSSGGRGARDGRGRATAWAAVGSAGGLRSWWPPRPG